MNRKALTGRRIKEARLALGWSQNYLGELYGCSGVAISKIERGITGLNYDDVERMASILGQHISYFLQDDVRHHQRPLEAVIKELEAIQPIAIPIFDQTASAGPGAPIQEYAYWSPPRAAGRNIKAVRVRGDCLLPLLQNGDVVFFDEDVVPRDGQLVVVLCDDCLCVKRYRQKGNEKWLEKNNERIVCDETLIQGTVISYQRWLA